MRAEFDYDTEQYLLGYYEGWKNRENRRLIDFMFGWLAGSVVVNIIWIIVAWK